MPLSGLSTCRSRKRHASDAQAPHEAAFLPTPSPTTARTTRRPALAEAGIRDAPEDQQHTATSRPTSPRTPQAVR
jgi:hypothetical protein